MAMAAVGTPAAAAACCAASLSAPGPPSKKRENWLRHCFVRCPSCPHLRQTQMTRALSSVRNAAESNTFAHQQLS
jgi:hypothetical protein